MVILMIHISDIPYHQVKFTQGSIRTEPYRKPGRALHPVQGETPIFEPSRPYIVWVRDTFRGSARYDGADTMPNLNNPNEINIVDEGSADASRPGEQPRHDDETLAEYLARTGTSPVREVSVFAGVKKPKRPKPTFTFPSVPPLF
jgi:hypothetical protein